MKPPARRPSVFLAGLTALLLAGVPHAVADRPPDTFDWDNVKTHLENWIGAASVALPAPLGLPVTGLSAMPGSLKGGLIVKCKRNIFEAQQALTPDVDQATRARLMLIEEKNQHLLAALGGKPEGLEKFLERHGAPQPQPTGGGAPGPTVADEERDDLDDLLARYRTRLDDLRERARKEHARFERLRGEIDRELADVRAIGDWAGTRTERYDELHGALTTSGEQVATLDRTAQAYAVVTIDGEQEVRDALADAERRAAACRTATDAALIRARYDDAKRSAARMTKDLERADQEAASRDLLVDAGTAMAEAFDYPGSLTRDRASASGKQDELSTLEKALGPAADDLSDSFIELVRIEADADALLAQVTRSRDDYRKTQPQSKQAFDDLIVAITRDASLDAPERRRSRVDWSTPARDARGKLDALLGLSVVDPKGDPRTGEVLELARGARDAALLALVAGEHVLAAADRCGTPATPPPAAPTPGSGVAPPQPTSQGGGSVQLLPPPAAPQPQYAGGLRIVGPARLVAGQGTTYVATDGAGTPYPDGVTWNSSAEHLMPVHDGGVAQGLRPGRATVVAHRGDMTAFLDVEIFAEVPNVTGLPVLQAMQRVHAAGLSGSSPGGGPTTPPSGTVTGQSPAHGTVVSAGTKVVVRTDQRAAPAAPGQGLLRDPTFQPPPKASSSQRDEQRQHQQASFDAFMQTLGTLVDTKKDESSGHTPLPQNELPPRGDGPILPPGSPVGDPVNAPPSRPPTAPPSTTGSGGADEQVLGGWDRSGTWHDGRAVLDHCRSVNVWGWVPCRTKRGSCVWKVKFLKDNPFFGVKAGEVRCKGG